MVSGELTAVERAAVEVVQAKQRRILVWRWIRDAVAWLTFVAIVIAVVVWLRSIG